MEHLRHVAVVLFLAAIPLFLVTTNIRWVIATPFLYSYGFDKYDITLRTDIERNELLLAADQIRDYFDNDVEDLDVKVVQRGVRRSLYNAREVAHMRDVKRLVRGVYRTQEIAALYLLAFAALGLRFTSRKFLRRLGRYIGFGGVVTLGLVLIVGIGSLVGFDRLFLAFHMISFDNDLWQLDPRRDYLLVMFPEDFFFDATMWIAASTVVEALVLSLPTLYFLWWRHDRTQR